MSLIHVLDSFSKGGLTGSQTEQRDWSPYVVHFTNWTAMRPFREMFKNPIPFGPCNQLPQDVHSALEKADKESFDVFGKIVQAGKIRASSPSDKDGIPECVCFSECNLPGLIGHCERYGRFGFVFSKQDILSSPLNGRPCLYVEEPIYTIIDVNCSNVDDNRPESEKEARKRLFGLSNVYSPPGRRVKIQDFTHEREWRVFSDVPLDSLRAVVCPLSHYDPVVGALENRNAATRPEGRDGRDRAPDGEGDAPSRIPVIPIDMLFEWGA